MPDSPTLLPVEQCDRDAAADYGLATNAVSSGQADSIRRGEWDDLPRVQRFAFYRTRLAAQSSPAREGLIAAEKFIRMFKDSGVEQLSEGVHAGLRKGTDAADAATLWAAISRSQTTAWPDAIAFAHDPFFSMWGGDEALDLIARALSANDTQPLAHPSEEGK